MHYRQIEQKCRALNENSVSLYDFFLFQLVNASFFGVVQMSGTINIVITDNFALETNSQDSKELKETEADESNKESPETDDGSTEHLINDDFTFSGVIIEDTVDGVEESSTEETNEAGGSKDSKELGGIIDLGTVFDVGSDNISGSTDHTNNKGSPVVNIGVDTSSNADHTSDHSLGNSGGIFSDGSSSGKDVNKDHGNETSTGGSEDSTRGSNFSISVEETVL